MIDDPVRPRFSVALRLADKNHCVIRELLNPRLMEKKKIAFLGAAPVAADEHAIEILERASIGKLREPASFDVALLKRTKIYSKEFFAKRGRFKVERFYIWRDVFVSRAHLVKPRPVVLAQRLAPREPDQSRSIAMFGVPFITGLVELHLGYCRKPASEVLTIIEPAQLGFIRDAVRVGIH